jgi:hypothetical protein
MMKYIHNVAHGLLAAHVIKGCLSDQQFVCQYSYGPDIHEVIIRLTLKDLRANVI